MRRETRPTILALALVAIALPLAAAVTPAGAQVRLRGDDRLRAERRETENALEGIAVIDRKVMVPMRDGVRLATDVYRPRDADGPVPTIFVRTPYNFNWWDIQLGAPRDMSRVLDAVRRGYAYVVQNERGHFFSEGNYDILGPPRTDGFDMLSWIGEQPWSNGKVGLLGCSSTAEWQMGVAATENPHLAAINPQGFGAGVGRVDGWYEQGNWYRGGAVQMLFIAWLYGEQNQVRPMFPPGTSQEDLIRASRSFDLAQHLPPVDWSKALRHLPVEDIMETVGGPHGIFADSMPVPTGGRMIQRTPDDPAWYRGGLYHDDMPFDVPGLWFMSWYDVSIGPNLAMFNHARKAASPKVADEQWAIVAPTLHCSYTRATENTIVGERSVGDARFDYASLTYGFFDRFLKGEASAVLDTTPKVRYYLMGRNEWKSSDSWPPAGSTTRTLYLSSGGSANMLYGDGALAGAAPGADAPDRFTYDPMNPVPSHGGNVCCTGNAVEGGALDQREMETRDDILVYATPPLEEGMEVSGPVKVTLYVSSDARDTDFTVKLLDVYPDGRAYNLDETIQRLRYREGYDRQVWMEPGKVYEVALGPLTTSNYFEAGHRIRIEVSSSNFPRFGRNLNTGGHNYDEAEGVTAHNAVHHSRRYPSRIELTVVPGS
ncbi:MAG TPA: CocE/NonD family hydrolase [Gemmatimonadota bacterium]|nr:CocE/NonD family hydrolase [Gemmatimonadota bacterium]